MKFWQKIFIAVLLTFMIFFDAGVLMLLNYTFENNLERERTNGLREQGIILSAFRTALDGGGDLETAVNSISKYHESLGVYLEVLYEGERIFTNAPQAPEELYNGEETKTSRIKTDGGYYYAVASQLPGHGEIRIIYFRDITGIYSFRAQISRYFIFASAAICVGLGIFIYMVLKRITAPISRLNATTREIASGSYHRRVSVKSKDELGELGQTFNAMAEAVEEKMSQLMKSAEDKQRFINNLSHEMRTPLTSIIGYSEYLINAKVSEEERFMVAGYIFTSAKRMHDLWEKLLSLIYLQKNEFKPLPVAAAPLLEELRQIITPSLEKRELSLVTNILHDEIIGDNALILILLLNLTENAARASKPGGVIRILVYRDDFTVVEVIDKGCGMTQSEVERITEPFYRADPSRSREAGGLGLGLSICKQIVDLHGARLEFVSSKENGTAVKIIFAE